MKKKPRIRVGDVVIWPGGPNEFGDNRRGTVLGIKKGIATISGYFDSKTRQVPIQILKKKC